jgi:transposase
MPRAYSLDLRDRVVRFVEAGRSCHAAAAYFCVSVSFAVRLMGAFRTAGSLAPKPSGGRRHAKLDPHRAFLIARIEEKAGITMPELSAELAAATGTKADPASLSRFFIRNGYRFKKPCERASKIAPTSKRRAKSGRPSGSRECGLSQISSSLSTRPERQPS